MVEIGGEGCRPQQKEMNSHLQDKTRQIRIEVITKTSQIQMDKRINLTITGETTIDNRTSMIDETRKTMSLGEGAQGQDPGLGLHQDPGPDLDREV